MGCGGSRLVDEYLEKNKDAKFGKQSDFENALTLLEEKNKLTISSVLKVEYNEKVKHSTLGENCQQWIVQASYVVKKEKIVKTDEQKKASKDKKAKATEEEKKKAADEKAKKKVDTKEHTNSVFLSADGSKNSVEVGVFSVKK
jgi:mannitol-specific phosphotransferase system IIBC component